MTKKKHPAAVELGRLGGLIGGKSKSPAKLAALAAAREQRSRKARERAKKKEQ